MTDPQLRAYELLQWQALAPLAEFDEDFDYVSLQRRRSDEALDAFDKANPPQSSPELTAFRELERLGHYTQDDFYSPTKAADGFYSKQLERLQARAGEKADPVSPTRGKASTRRQRTRLDGRYARHGNRARNRRRNSRP